MQCLRLGGYKSFHNYHREIPKLGCLPRSVCTLNLVLLQSPYSRDKKGNGQVWGLPLMMQTLGDSLVWKLALLARLQPGYQLWLLSWVSSLLWLGSQDWYRSDCPCHQQIPENQVGANESGPPRGPRGIPVRMGAGVDPDSESWNGGTEQKDLAKFSMARRCPNPNYWSFHPHTVS